MQVIQTSKESASVSLTGAELVLLNNALNEVLNGIEIPEFDTGLGTSRQDADELLHRIGSLLDKMK